MSDDTKKKTKKTLVGVGEPSAEEVDASEASEGELEAEAKASEDTSVDASEEQGSDEEDSDEEDSDEEDSDEEDSDEEGSDEEDSDEEDSDDEEDVAASSRDESDHGHGGGSDHHDDEDDEIERRPALYLAQYETPEALHRAACQVRDAGFEKWDCHTPYAIHGMDDAMGLPPTKIGIISFVHGVIGVLSAILMIQFMNNWDYPIIVGGKPPGAFPPMVPIMFELTVLLTGFGTLFGLLHLMGLPRHHHPIFESERFAKASDDKFFISIEVKDPKFDMEETRNLLESTDPTFVELVEEELV